MENGKIAKKYIAIALATILALGSIAVFYMHGNSPIAAEKENETETEKITSGNEMAYEELFERDRINDIYIEISEADWESMLADPLAEEYKSATIKIGDMTLENVGFRTKGNLTLKSVASSDSDRYSFRVKLDKYEKGQNLLGLDEFVLNNMYSDPSYMREYLSYEALREIGADAPLASYANVYINGELFGFYLMVEAIDDSFLERNFGGADGNLYKQEQGSTLQYVEGSNYEKSELKVGSDESKTDLKNFIQILNEMPEGEKGDIESVLDVDSALKYIAVNTVLGNYDSYNGNLAQNYYLYGQNGKFTVIPWDYNMSIGGFGGGNNQITIPIDEPVLGVNMESLPLINNLLAVEEYKEKYHGYIQELLDYLENFEERVTQLASIIRPYVEADPTKFCTMEQFEASITYSEESTESTDSTTNTVPQDVDNQQENSMPPQQIRPQDEQQFQKPQGMPENLENGERPELPQGGRGGGARSGPGAGGRGMMASSTSILNFVRDRVENIKQQLSGQLPTTGNTTMNGNMQRGNQFNKMNKPQ